MVRVRPSSRRKKAPQLVHSSSENVPSSHARDNSLTSSFKIPRPEGDAGRKPSKSRKGFNVRDASLLDVTKYDKLQRTVKRLVWKYLDVRKTWKGQDHAAVCIFLDKCREVHWWLSVYFQDWLIIAMAKIILSGTVKLYRYDKDKHDEMVLEELQERYNRARGATALAGSNPTNSRDDDNDRERHDNSAGGQPGVHWEGDSEDEHQDRSGDYQEGGSDDEGPFQQTPALNRPPSPASSSELSSIPTEFENAIVKRKEGSHIRQKHIAPTEWNMRTRSTRTTAAGTTAVCRKSSKRRNASDTVSNLVS